MLHLGDCFDVLPTLLTDSVDACVTDPPYGIGFMGKEWDTFSPEVSQRLREKGESWTARRPDNPNLNGRKRQPGVSPSAVEYDRSLDGQHGFQAWSERWARAVLRVLKPGAYLLVCGAPRSFHRMTCGLEDAGFEIRDCLSWLYGQGFPKSLNLGDGHGTALKPGWEPIILARKPFRGTLLKNHAMHGTGALNVDESRIGAVDTRRVKAGGAHDFPREDDAWTPKRVTVGSDLGRWPANVVLDDEAAAALDQQSGVLASGFMAAGTERDGLGYHGARGNAVSHDTIVDVGGASRFFYVAKPSREERDVGCEGLTAQARDETRKAGNPGGDNPRNRGLQPRGNCHPTVKPVALMRWLVKLVTPIGGTVLDPFTGSGTTGMACAYEQRGFIGIEREATYVAIAQARIAQVAPLFAEAAP